jgi:hypothetical protein
MKISMSNDITYPAIGVLIEKTKNPKPQIEKENSQDQIPSQPEKNQADGSKDKKVEPEILAQNPVVVKETVVEKLSAAAPAEQEKFVIVENNLQQVSEDFYLKHEKPFKVQAKKKTNSPLQNLHYLESINIDSLDNPQHLIEKLREKVQPNLVLKYQAEIKKFLPDENSLALQNSPIIESLSKPRIAKVSHKNQKKKSKKLKPVQKLRKKKIAEDAAQVESKRREAQKQSAIKKFRFILLGVTLFEW